MATPKKQVKLEPTEDHVQGFVHLVSPIKKSVKNKTPYFQCIIQTGKNDFDELVSFSADKHATFAQASEKRTPLHLTGITKSFSYRSSSGTSILCRRTTEIKTCDHIGFHFKLPSSNPWDKRSQDIELANLPKQVTGNYVNVTAKVLLMHPKRHIHTKFGDTDVCDAVIADSTGSGKLTLWADKICKIQEGKSYCFSCLTVKEFSDELSLSTSADTTFSMTQDPDDIYEDEDMMAVQLIGTPISIKMSMSQYCIHCNKKIQLPPIYKQKKSYKCEECGMRMLTSNIKTISSAKMKLDSNPNIFEIPGEILSGFDIDDEDEMEEFLLENEFTITIPTKGSTIVSGLQKKE